MRASWDHILANMLLLAIFSKNVENAFGQLGYRSRSVRLLFVVYDLEATRINSNQ